MHISPVAAAPCCGKFPLMWGNVEIYREIERRMRLLKLTPRQLSLESGLNETALKAIRTGKSADPRYGTLRKIATRLGCTVADLTGDHATAKPVRVAPPVRESIDYAGEAYSAVPAYDVRAAAGAGAMNGDHEEPENFVLYRSQWLQRITRAPVETLAVIRVAGDSMWETLHDGDQVLVDRSIRSVGRDGLYVLRLGDELQVKRVSRHPTSKLLTIRSDNPAYPTHGDIDPEGLDIAGRVIWLGRNVG